MSLHDNATALIGRMRSFEGDGANSMPKSAKVLCADDFGDGHLNGWMPTHMSGDRLNQPLTVSQGYPLRGLMLSSGSVYNPVSLQCAAYKRLAFRRATGIVSLSVEYAVGGETDARQWSSFGIEMDLQGWNGALRAHPRLQVDSPGIGVNSGATASIFDDTQTKHEITSIANPITGDTNHSTRGLLAGENENKFNVGYLRLSFDLGNLLTQSAEPSTAHYYEANINGFVFDLRATQPNDPGRGKQSVQGGTPIESFNGGLNAGVTLSQDPSATGAAMLYITSAVMTYHETGWLA